MREIHVNNQNSKRQVFGKEQVADNREYSIDILRGIAVLLMISAHVLFFFHNGQSSILNFTQKIGDTFAFIVFLFISGVVSFILFELKKDKKAELKSKILKRIIILVFGYYITAIISNFKQYDFTSDAWIFQVLEIIIFKNVPGFTEFMIPFIFFSLLQVFVPGFYSFLGKRVLLAFVIGIILYTIGYALYFTPVPDSLNAYKVLFSSADGFYRFPILQYSIVFLVGLTTGNFLFKEKNIYNRRKRLFQLFVFFLILFSVLYFGKIFSSFTEFDDFERWPPTLGFIFAGITFSFLIMFIVIKRANKHTMPYIYKFFYLIGKDSFLYFTIHIILLQVYDILLGFKSGNILIVLLLSIFAFIITLYTVKISKKINKSIFVTDNKTTTLTPGEYRTSLQSRQTTMKLTLVSIIIIIGLAGGVFFLFGDKNEVSGYELRESTVNLEVFSKKEEKLPAWWNYDYGYFRKISIFNQGLFSNISKGTWDYIELNHQDLIKTNKSLVNGNDLRIVYQDGETYTELATKIENLSATDTKVYFQTTKDIEAGTSDKNYYVYYGNKLATPRPESPQSIGSIAETQKTILSTEKQGALSLAVDKYWLLKDTIDQNVSTLTVSMDIYSKPFTKTGVPEYTYKVIGTPLEGKLFATGDAKKFESKIDISILKPGIYQIQASGKVADQEVISPKESFVVSYPLYVTWTMDWEGLDAKDSFLNSMDRISNQYGVPISHFFNPRIYIALNSSRSKYLTDWVKERQRTRGDSIDLHLHMWQDMVEAAGLDPLNTGGVDYDGNPIETAPRPSWGSPTGRGYDTLMTSYSYDETMKLLEWAKNKFIENGLPTPRGFRAGGWYLDSENMLALEDSGFLYDSSGRTSYSFGSQRAQGPWNLSATTQPYRPSRSDQNSPNPPPNLGIWEFPNNGADSYAFGSDEMLRRFNANYSGGYLDEKKLVTFLSHPEWFNIDEPKLDILFTFISQFLQKNDNGPVIFITLDQAYKSWT